ncbi:bifunctional diguanylate cyclase/phosphodiesterase [Vibrio cincinnatiensis]|uniref:bifunctional diguanylate cyclase/phosphodiesterase n=1 Tax=Vibrio cincinnatiensis TaxID=675 RepID=UPI001EDCB0BE|nr:EAL domain-containing protein [Vibrio cincinnatiensis]MCG3728509.1 EAL domain-containing protein [Vibrio cincinnatiensis]
MLRTINLEIKTALLFAVGLIGVVLSSLFLTRYFFLYSLYELENIEVHRASNQALSVVESVVQRQEESSYDWAYWDETYMLLTDRDPGYAERNLTEDGLDALDLDLVAYIRPNRTLLLSFARETDQSVQQAKQLLQTEVLTHYLQQMDKQLDAKKNSTASLVSIEQQLWAISLTAVRDSGGDTEAVGWMLWGQNLTNRFPQHYERILMADNQLSTDEQSVAFWNSAQQSGHDHLFIERTDQHLIHHTLLTNDHGKAIAVLKTTEPRLYYQRAKSVFVLLIVVMLAVTSAIALIMYGIFWVTVSRRFSYFEQGMQNLLSTVAAPEKNNHTDEFDRITQWVKTLALSSSQTEEKLQETLQKFDVLYHSRTVGMILLTDRIIVDVSPTVLMLLGFQRDQLIGQPLSMICGCKHTQCGTEQLYHSINQGQYHFETTMKRHDGSDIACSVEAALLNDGENSSIMLSVKDISEQKQQAELIETLKHCDPVSGLLNRQTLMKRVNHRIQQAETTFNVLYLYASRLKEIDDVYGHDYYDRIVQHLAATLKRHFPAMEIGRISEQEFMIWAEQPTLDFEREGNRVLMEYRQKIMLEDIECDIGLKAALLSSAIDFENFENLSHTGLYAVTHDSGTNTSVTLVHAQHFERTQELLVLNRDIVAALKNGEFTAHYQPIVKAESGQLVGFEALARWTHPTLGMISPAVFIPLAEQRKLIVELGEQILEKACQFIQQIQCADKTLSSHLSIHVNISSPHFHHNSLVETLHKVIETYHLLPGQLVLELTESILLGAEDDIIHRMETIKALGVQLALDDFGTGYSSFSSLCNFPLDIVKLDKSYIDGLETNSKAKSLIRNIIHMSKELGMTTVAEGVETASQLRKLTVWNIDEIQGYYFYKPMTAEQAFEKFTLY